jgi:hypothetical protein
MRLETKQQEMHQRILGKVPRKATGRRMTRLEARQQEMRQRKEPKRPRRKVPKVPRSGLTFYSRERRDECENMLVFGDDIYLECPGPHPFVKVRIPDRAVRGLDIQAVHDQALARFPKGGIHTLAEVMGPA